MNELYWITRFGEISIAVKAILIMSIIVFGVTSIAFGCTVTDGDLTNCEKREFLKVIKRFIKISFITTIISAIMFIFTPSQKDAYLIWGVGGTIDYLKENPTAKQIPDKCIKLLDKWVTDELENDSIK